MLAGILGGSKMREGIFHSFKKTWKRAAIVGLLGFGMTAGAVHADDVELQTIYHVYVDGEHIGIVEDQSIVQNYVNHTIAEEGKDSEDITYVIDEEISFIPEKVFNKEVENTEVLQTLQDQLTVEAVGNALTIGEEVVGYFATEEQAEQVLQLYKEKYVKPEILEALENNEQQQTLEVGDTQIVEVTLSEETSIAHQNVAPSKLISVEDGVTLLEKGTLEEKTHVVAEGEVLGSIASQYDLSLDTLLSLNNGLTEDSVIRVGDELLVTETKPYVTVMVVEESLREEEIPFEKEVKESESMYKGDEEITQEGKNGTAKKQYQITKVNGVAVKEEVINEEVTEEPVKEILVKGTKVVPSRGSGKFAWPAVGGYVSSKMGPRWGSYHKGIDIARPSNRNILAADNGRVVSAGWDSSGYGNKIVIDHGNGYRTIYAHMSSLNVSSGQVVEKGQKIGVMGSTGRSTGIHLHFEVYKNGARIDPLTVL